MLPSCSKAEDKFIHPSFAITAEELDNTAIELPEEIKTAITQDRKGFLNTLFPLLEIYDDLLTLADKSNPLSENYEPADLINLDEQNIKVK